MTITCTNCGAKADRCSGMALAPVTARIELSFYLRCKQDLCKDCFLVEVVRAMELTLEGAKT